MCADIVDPATPWGNGKTPCASAEKGRCGVCGAYPVARIEWRAVAPVKAAPPSIEDLLS